MLKTMKETALALGIAYTQLQSALFHGRIPEPAKRNGVHRLFSAEEIEALRPYFDRMRAAKRKTRLVAG